MGKIRLAGRGKGVARDHLISSRGKIIHVQRNNTVNPYALLLDTFEMSRSTFSE
jgi:hypothetical protein